MLITSLLVNCFYLKVEVSLDLQSLYMSLWRVQTFQTSILAMFLQVKYSDMQTRFTLHIKKKLAKKIQMFCYKSFSACFMAL